MTHFNTYCHLYHWHSAYACIAVVVLAVGKFIILVLFHKRADRKIMDSTFHEGWLIKSPPTKRIWRAVSEIVHRYVPNKATIFHVSAE